MNRKERGEGLASVTLQTDEKAEWKRWRACSPGEEEEEEEEERRLSMATSGPEQ